MVRNEYKSIVLGFCGGGGPGKQLPLMLWLAVEAVVSGKKGSKADRESEGDDVIQTM